MGCSVVNGRAYPRGDRVAVAVWCLALPLAACAPVSDPSVGLSVEESEALIEQAPRSELTPEVVAEAFALGTRATDVQRDLLERDLVGRTVEWQFAVYEVSYAEGRYKITSQPIPIQDPEAAPLLRVVAFVLPQGEADDALLRAVQTDDVIRVRGIVQEIRARTIVTIVPAVVVASKHASQAVSRNPEAEPVNQVEAMS